jgi:O-antigen/teichoic acid export membrane protein
MGESLRSKTISGMIWSGIQRFGTMSISFISNIILARLLVPEDFGCIGMLAFFMAVSDMFIDGGFGAALIQKKNPTQEDYSTIFYWNIIVACVFIVLLYFAAPFIASFYKIPLLCQILRVQSVVLLINAFSIIQRNQLRKQLNFKKLTYNDMIATIIGTVIAIILAYCGWGVWSLVARNLITGIVGTVTIWYITKWKPRLIFVWSSFKNLFGFGSMMFLSSMIETVYTNIQTLIIGRIYSVKDLGYYTQAKRMEEVPFNSMIAIVNQVAFPALSQVQHDLIKLKSVVRKNLIGLSFLNFPLCILLIVISKPLFIVLLTTKWNESIPYFNLFCIIGLMHTINTMHTNALKSIGRGKLFFYNSLLKRSIGLILIIIGAQFSMMELMIAATVSSYICFFINIIVSKRIFNYKLSEQMKDIMPCLIVAVLAGIATFFTGKIIEYLNIYFLLIALVITYILLYLFVSYIFKLEGLHIYYNIIKDKFIRRKK